MTDIPEEHREVVEEWERKAVWKPESDEHLPGRTEKREKTDQRCPHCGRWFENRGFNAHTADCYFAESDYYEFNEETEKIEYNKFLSMDRTQADEYRGRWLKVVEE